MRKDRERGISIPETAPAQIYGVGSSIEKVRKFNGRGRGTEGGGLRILPHAGANTFDCSDHLAHYDRSL